MAPLVLIISLIAVAAGVQVPTSQPQPWLLACVAIWLLWIFGKRSLFLLPGFAIIHFFIGSHASALSIPIPQSETGVFQMALYQPSDVRSDRTYLYGTVLTRTYGEIAIRAQAPRYPIFSSGDVVEIRGVIKPAKTFLRPAKIRGEMQAKDPPTLLTKSLEAENIFLQFRKAIEHKINEEIPEPESSFLSGLLLGSKRSIPKHIQDDLKTTGTSHLVAISGANVTFLLGFALLLFPLRTNLSRAFAICAIALFLCLLTGSSSSVVRGAVMATIPAIVQAAGRPVHAPTSILLAGYLMILMNPLIFWYDAGFQLSFSAFLGVAYIQPLLKHITLFVPENLRKSVPFSSFIETAAASLGTAPVMALNGNAPITILGFIANPLVLWIVPIASLLGCIFLVAHFLPLIGPLIAQVTWVPLHAILLLIHQTAQIHV